MQARPAKIVPEGIEDFLKIIRPGRRPYLYVDNTQFIIDFLNGPEGTILYRPSRWGKSLALSMLKYFFAPAAQYQALLGKQSNEFVTQKFKDLTIGQADSGSYINQYHSKYPVIFITLKDVKEKNYPAAVQRIRDVIVDVYRQNENIIQDHSLTDSQKKLFRHYLDGNVSEVELQSALLRLSEFLHAFYKEYVIIIIDEFDAAINSGFENNYVNEISNFMKNFLSTSLKSNLYLEKSIITGVFSVSRENMPAALNNCKVFSVLNSDRYQQSYGFTIEQVKQLIIELDGSAPSEDLLENLGKYYGGYHQDGNTFNPLSIIQYLGEQSRALKPYWINPSENEIVKTALINASIEVKQDLQKLLNGESIQVTVDEHIQFIDLKTNDSIVWSLLVASGHLQCTAKTQVNTMYDCTLKIPNLETHALITDVFKKWFEERIGRNQYTSFLNSLISGDIATFTESLGKYLRTYTSYHDWTREDNHHAFLLGLMCSVTDSHYFHSNIEAGTGRLDLILIPKDTNKNIGFIIELKLAKSEAEIAKKLAEAIAQIEDKDYGAMFNQHKHIAKEERIALVFAPDKQVATNAHTLCRKTFTPASPHKELLQFNSKKRAPEPYIESKQTNIPRKLQKSDSTPFLAKTILSSDTGDIKELTPPTSPQ